MRMLISTDLRYTAIAFRIAADLTTDPDQLFSIIEEIDKSIDRKWFDFFNQDEIPLIDKPLKLSQVGVEELKRISPSFSSLKPVDTTLFDVLKIMANAAKTAGLTEAYKYIKSKADNTEKVDRIMDITNEVIKNPKYPEARKSHMIKMAIEDLERIAKGIMTDVKTSIVAFVHANG